MPERLRQKALIRVQLIECGALRQLRRLPCVATWTGSSGTEARHAEAPHCLRDRGCKGK